MVKLEHKEVGYTSRSTYSIISFYALKEALLLYDNCNYYLYLVKSPNMNIDNMNANPDIHFTFIHWIEIEHHLEYSNLALQIMATWKWLNLSTNCEKAIGRCLGFTSAAEQVQSPTPA